MLRKELKEKEPNDIHHLSSITEPLSLNFHDETVVWISADVKVRLERRSYIGLRMCHGPNWNTRLRPCRA